MSIADIFNKSASRIRKMTEDDIIQDLVDKIRRGRERGYNTRYNEHQLAAYAPDHEILSKRIRKNPPSNRRAIQTKGNSRRDPLHRNNMDIASSSTLDLSREADALEDQIARGTAQDYDAAVMRLRDIDDELDRRAFMQELNSG